MIPAAIMVEEAMLLQAELAQDADVASAGRITATALGTPQRQQSALARNGYKMPGIEVLRVAQIRSRDQLPSVIRAETVDEGVPTKLAVRCDICTSSLPQVTGGST